MPREGFEQKAGVIRHVSFSMALLAVLRIDCRKIDCRKEAGNPVRRQSRQEITAAWTRTVEMEARRSGWILDTF